MVHFVLLNYSRKFPPRMTLPSVLVSTETRAVFKPPFSARTPSEPLACPSARPSARQAKVDCRGTLNCSLRWLPLLDQWVQHWHAVQNRKVKKFKSLGEFFSHFIVAFFRPSGKAYYLLAYFPCSTIDFGGKERQSWPGSVQNEAIPK